MLYAFQDEGADWLLQEPRRYLADDMGTGKTVTACAAAKRGEFPRVLVVSPASAIENWYREWRTHGHEGAEFVATSYGSRTLRAIRPAEWSRVIVDEAHYCKSNKAQRTLAVLDIARKAQGAWLLSATPMPNHPGELWTPLRALWPEIPAAFGLKRHDDWFNHFCLWTKTKYGKHVYDAKNTEALAPHLRRIMLRRTLDDVGVQMPPLRVDVSLLPRDSRFATALAGYGIDAEDLEQKIAAEDDEDGSIARLRRLIGEYKAPLIGDILAEELRTQQYKKLVVLAYHRSVLDILTTKLSKYGVVGFNGDASPRARQFAIDTFRDSESVQVFVGQQTAAGIAINLQAATEVVLVEPDWSPDANAQAIKRIHRIGSTAPCRARIFAVAASLDEGMMRSRAAKIRMQTGLGLNGKDTA